jgi:hypothetical protein
MIRVPRRSYGVRVVPQWNCSQIVRCSVMRASCRFGFTEFMSGRLELPESSQRLTHLKLQRASRSRAALSRTTSCACAIGSLQYGRQYDYRASLALMRLRNSAVNPAPVREKIDRMRKK